MIIKNSVFDFLHFLHSYKVLFFNKIKLFNGIQSRKSVGSTVGTVGLVGM